MTQNGTPSLSRPIIIVGVDRSGTSMVSNMVHAWGAYGGDVEGLSRPSRWNRYGCWENEQQQRVTGDLLNGSGKDYWEPHYRDVIARRAQEPSLRARAQQFVAGMSTHPFWFCKEPWISVQLPFWQQFWDDAVYIITVRNPRDSADSMMPFVIPEVAAGQVNILALLLLRWQIFMLSILRDTADTHRKLFVEYERMTTTSHTEAARLCDFLCRELGVAKDDRAERMSAIVRPDEHHHARSQPFAHEQAATDAQRALYAFLQRKVDDPDLPFDVDAYPFYPGYREYFANMAFAKDYVASTSRLMRSYPVRVGLAVHNGLRPWRKRYKTLKKYVSLRVIRQTAG